MLVFGVARVLDILAGRPRKPSNRRQPIGVRLHPSVIKIAVVAFVAAGATVRADERAIPVSVGGLAALGDAAIFIADKKGFFADEGLSVKLTTFRSGADMIAPLATGQIDVGAGSPSAGLYNAVARGMRIKIVADKAYAPTGYGASKLIIRRDLLEGGRVRGVSDLKGLKIATPAPGVSIEAMLSTALQSAGHRLSDTTIVHLPFPDHIVALRNKAIDAAATIEPFATLAAEQGVAVTLKRDDEIDPDHQVAVLLYSEKFGLERRRTAVAFMRAYLRAVRYYNRALHDGRLAGETAADVIAILAEYTNVKDPRLLAKVTPPGLNPTGRVNEASLQRDLDFFASQGHIRGNVDIKAVVDMSFVEEASQGRSRDK